MAEGGGRERQGGDRMASLMDKGVKANERLTVLTGLLLVVLLALMLLTVTDVRRLLLEHFFLGLLLLPVIALKMASTGWRFMRYYMGSAKYRQAGTPVLWMRLLAIVVVGATVTLFASGVELWAFGLRFGATWLEVHKLSFMIWLLAVGLHVLGKLPQTLQGAREELRAEGGAHTRRALVVDALLAGVALAVASLSYASPFGFFREG
jgi:hypothetical protein